jgi:hypothetical protein
MWCSVPTADSKHASEVRNDSNSASRCLARRKMAQPLMPNFENISTALSTLEIEIRRMANLPALSQAEVIQRGQQEIVEYVQGVETSLTEMRGEIQQMRDSNSATTVIRQRQ